MKTLANELDAQELVQRIASLQPQDQPQWGTMSVGDMVCHCRQAFRGAAGDFAFTPKPGPLPGPVLKRIALRSSWKWPPNIETVHELKPGQPGVMPADFERDRAELLAEVERFRTLALTNPHPIFGSMTPADWLRWGYLHTDHHLRQFGR